MVLQIEKVYYWDINTSNTNNLNSNISPNTNSHIPINSLAGHEGTVNQVSFNSEYNILGSCGSDGNIILGEM